MSTEMEMPSGDDHEKIECLVDHPGYWNAHAASLSANGCEPRLAFDDGYRMMHRDKVLQDHVIKTEGIEIPTHFQLMQMRAAKLHQVRRKRIQDVS